MTAELIDDGTLIPVRVEGLKETRHVLADELPILETVAQPDPDRVPGVSFLAPLGPMMWDRRLIRDLFGFAYIWEVYVPQPKRRHGYYVLPILLRRSSRRPNRAALRARHQDPASSSASGSRTASDRWRSRISFRP